MSTTDASQQWKKFDLEALLALVVDCRGRHFPLLLVERGETALVLIYPAGVLAATSHTLPRHFFPTGLNT